MHWLPLILTAWMLALLPVGVIVGKVIRAGRGQ